MPAGCRIALVVAPPLLLVLLRCRLHLTTNRIHLDLLLASWLPRCPCCCTSTVFFLRLCLNLLFASWLLHCPCCCAVTNSCPLVALPTPCNEPPLPCNMPPLPCNAPPPLVCWHLSSHLPLVLQLVVTLHFVMPPPHVSILDLHLHLHRLVVVSYLVPLPPPPILSSTLSSLDVLPPHITPATHLPFASHLPQLVACVFDLACIISWCLAVISRKTPYCTAI